MATFVPSRHESLIDSVSPPLSVVIALDMQDHVQPIMFSFDVAPAPMQLKILQAVGNMVELAKTCSFDKKQKNLFRSALDKARLVASNSTFNAKVVHSTASAKPTSDGALELKESTHGEQSRTNFTSRHRRIFARQSTPRENLESPIVFPKMQCQSVIHEEPESGQSMRPFTTGDLPAHTESSQRRADTESVVDDDFEDDLSDTDSEKEEEPQKEETEERKEKEEKEEEEEEEETEEEDEEDSAVKLFMKLSNTPPDDHESNRPTGNKASNAELQDAITPQFIPPHQPFRLPHKGIPDVDHDVLGMGNAIQDLDIVEDAHSLNWTSNSGSSSSASDLGATGVGQHYSCTSAPMFPTVGHAPKAPSDHSLRLSGAPLGDDASAALANDVTKRRVLDVKAGDRTLFPQCDSPSSSFDSNLVEFGERTARRSRLTHPVHMRSARVSVPATPFLPQVCPPSADDEVLGKGAVTQQDDGTGYREEGDGSDDVRSRSTSRMLSANSVTVPADKVPSHPSLIRSSMRARQRSSSSGSKPEEEEDDAEVGRNM
eukprot:TRINITY_DN7510_c0_g2_i1.p1 TRINITY_DN7510_c0_g2~~TRINITY_DN7510_c0_g2_i1.p1  ORF type:complete len:545 (-),score=101.79 TRINITY_DN7510_c0_g2_i1:118-1752(-)